jgi:hypothetical protein
MFILYHINYCLSIVLINNYMDTEYNISETTIGEDNYEPPPISTRRLSRMVSGITSYLSLRPTGTHYPSDYCVYRKLLGTVGFTEFYRNG